MALKLQERLEQLGYGHLPFSRESTVLVQRLLEDLVRTTDSFRKEKLSKKKCSSDVVELEKKIGPLRREVTHATAENNQLHMSLIKQAEEQDEREKDVQLMVRTYENEISDLKFVKSQHVELIKKEQRKVEQERKKIEDWMKQQGVFAAMMKGKAKAKGAKEDDVYQKLQRIELEVSLGLESSLDGDLSGPDLETVDVIKMYDDRMRTLEKNATNAEVTINDLESQLTLSRNQIASRETEIARLGAELEKTRSCILPPPQEFDRDPSASSSAAHTAQQRVTQLEAQLSYFQERNSELEGRSARAAHDQAALRASWESEKAENASQLERAQEKNNALKENLVNLEHLVEDLETMRNDLASKGELFDGSALSSPEKGSRRKKADEGFRSPWTSVGQQQQGASPLIRKLRNENNVRSEQYQEEFKEAKHAITQLRKDIAHLFNHLGSQPVKQNTSKTDRRPKPAEHDENEMELLRQELKKCRHDLRQMESEYQAALAKGAQNTSGNKHDKLGDSSKRIQGMNDRLKEAEREYQNVSQRLRDANEEMDDMCRERDSLITALRKFEQQFTDVQNDIRSVTTERNNIQLLYEQTHKELQSTRRNLSNKVAATSVPKTTVDPNDDRNNSALALEEYKLEINRLKDTLDETTKELNELRKQYDKVLATSEKSISSLKDERDRLQAGATELIYDAHVAQEKLEQNTKELHSVQLENNEKKEELKRTKTLLDQLKNEENLHRDDLRRRASEIEVTLEKLHRTEEELADLRKDYARQGESLLEQRKLLTNVDQDRDALHGDLDAKTENLLKMEDYVKSLRGETHQLQEQLMNTRNNADSLNQHLNEQEHEIQSLRRQLDELIATRERLSEDNKIHEVDVRNLKTDLTALTQENQILNNEITGVSKERDQLKNESFRSQDTIDHLSRVITSKEEEREQLMASYRKLIGDHERLDHNWKATSEDTNQLRMGIVLRDNKIQFLQKSLDEHATAARQMKVDFQAYEEQSNHLTHTLASVERELSQSEEAKETLTRDIAASRDLLASMERSKEDIQKQLSMQAVEKQQLRSAIGAFEVEKNALVAEINQEKARCEKLEQLLTIERTAKYHDHLKEQEANNRKISREEHLQSQQTQQQLTISSLKSKLGQANSVIAELKESLMTLETEMAKVKSVERDREEDVKRTQLLVDQLREQVAVSDGVIEKLKKLPHSSSNGIENLQTSSPLSNGKVAADRLSLEHRISEELEATKRELKVYEEQISKGSASDNSKRMKSSSEDESNDFAEQLLVTWQAQNDAMRRELLALQLSPKNDADHAAPLVEVSNAKAAAGVGPRAKLRSEAVEASATTTASAAIGKKKAKNSQRPPSAAVSSNKRTDRDLLDAILELQTNYT